MDFSMIRFQVGSITCRVFADSIGPLTEARVNNIFANDVAQHGDRVQAAFRALPEPPQISQNILFIEHDNRRILVDTGEGMLDPNQPGQLFEWLRRATISPESIDMVILTHFHLDHIGGLLNVDGQTNFPKARLIAPVPEHGYWLDPAHLASIDVDRAALLQKTFDTYSSAGGVVLLDAKAEIIQGINYSPLFGHTPGQCGVLVESNGKRLLHVADTVHMSIQLNLADAAPKFDVMPDKAIVTRRALIERAAHENLRIMAYHFPFPGVGHIVATQDRFEWIPDPALEQA